jgi:hypothetical protein
MYDKDGFRQLQGIDSSAICIQQIEDRNRERRPENLYMVMDCTKMDFKDDSFDLVIDKGTMDTLLCENLGYYKTARYLKKV